MDKPMTLLEKWAADAESYKRSGGMAVTGIQCRFCRHWIKSSALNCEKFDKTNKPAEILSGKKECPCFECSEPIDLMAKNEFERRLKGGIFGAIVGDALGVPVEFSDRSERQKDPVREMRGYGTYRQPMGTWSDDSSMLLCLVEALTEGYSAEKLAEKFALFANSGYLTPYGTVFDIGNAVRKAVSKISAGIPPTMCGGDSEYDNGNGSLMRILPLAFYLENADFSQKISLIEEVSAITHRHPISLLSCIIYVQLASELMAGKDKKSTYFSTMDQVVSGIGEKYSEVLGKFENILSGKLLSLKERRIKSSGYVLDSLEASLWCFMCSDSFEECVFRAINLGEDTDTIACIAGGLAGIYYGVDAINDNWIQMLAGKNMLNDMVDGFIGSLL